ncbi:MAG: hypothetical protein FWF52_04255 [Candidatus Azobacteroides sp.]|nr:hypothetical protein [Candidatus Azobacteroides sp.]
MAKTGQQIEDDLFGMVLNSPLASFISGGVYKYGTRPHDSKKEDAVVKFVTGYNDGDYLQNGTVVVNIYVPDVDSNGSGVLLRDIKRCKAVETKASQWVESLTTGQSNYLFRTAQTIYTEEEPEIKQHFVSIRLKFKLSTF